MLRVLLCKNKRILYLPPQLPFLIYFHLKHKYILHNSHSLWKHCPLFLSPTLFPFTSPSTDVQFLPSVHIVLTVVTKTSILVNPIDTMQFSFYLMPLHHVTLLSTPSYVKLYLPLIQTVPCFFMVFAAFFFPPPDVIGREWTSSVHCLKVDILITSVFGLQTLSLITSFIPMALITITSSVYSWVSEKYIQLQGHLSV